MMLLRDFASRHRLGTVLGSNAVMQLGDRRFSPEVSFLQIANEARIRNARVIGPMDMVVEVLSTSTRTYDRGDKLKAYRDACVPEIWLVDPDHERFAAHILAGDGAYSASEISTGSFKSLALSGFELKVGLLTAAAQPLGIWRHVRRRH